MFERPRKKTIDKAHLHGLTRTTPAKVLISKHKRPEQIQAISKTCQFEPMRFQALCESLLYQLLNYTQQLPDTTNSYFSSPGGAFDHALSRTQAACELFQRFLLETPDEKLSEIQQLWWYALFSAGLLRGMGKLVLDYSVQLYNQHGHLIQTWEPLITPLFGTAHAYQFDTINHDRDETYRQRLNIVLAQHLMPKEGFTWLTQNIDVFEVWLALLHEDSATAGALGLILDRADAVAIQEDIINALPDIQHPKHAEGQAHLFVDIPADTQLNREQLIGAEFLKWLLINLEASKLTFNQHPLTNVAGGTLIGPDTFKLFARESPLFKNWQAVMRGLESLGLHDTTPGRTDKQSVLLKGSLGLPNTFQHQSKQDDTLTDTNAIDARHPGALKKLSSTGQWHAPHTETAAGLKPKNHFL